MENFHALQDIDNFCKVLVKKTQMNKPDNGGWSQIPPSEKAFLEKGRMAWHLGGSFTTGSNEIRAEHEEPFVDVFDEEDHVKILVQCRCREQQVTFQPSRGGIVVCREECQMEKNGQEMCTDLCRKLSIPTEGLQLDNMLFIIAKCNNNNTLEVMIPKLKQ